MRTELQRAIENLDQWLTRKVDPSAWERYPASAIERWMDGDRMVYLSDGGYSRLYFDVVDDRATVVLGSESTSRAKKRWASAGHFVEAVRRIFQQEVDRELAGDTSPACPHTTRMFIPTVNDPDVLVDQCQLCGEYLGVTGPGDPGLKMMGDSIGDGEPQDEEPGNPFGWTQGLHG